MTRGRVRRLFAVQRDPFGNPIRSPWYWLTASAAVALFDMLVRGLS